MGEERERCVICGRPSAFDTDRGETIDGVLICYSASYRRIICPKLCDDPRALYDVVTGMMSNWRSRVLDAERSQAEMGAALKKVKSVSTKFSAEAAFTHELQKIVDDGLVWSDPKIGLRREAELLEISMLREAIDLLWDAAVRTKGLLGSANYPEREKGELHCKALIASACEKASAVIDMAPEQFERVIDREARLREENANLRAWIEDVKKKPLWAVEQRCQAALDGEQFKEVTRDG